MKNGPIISRLGVCNLLFLVCIVFFDFHPTHAEMKNWTGAQGLWSEDSRWSPYGVPNPGDEVYINAAYSTVTFDWIYSDPLFGLEIDWHSTLYIPSNGYKLRVGSPDQGGRLIIGKSGVATLTQDGGSVLLNGGYGALILGHDMGSYGYYRLNAGELILQGFEEYIGASGAGIFEQYGGIHTLTGAIYVGLGNGGYGEYRLYDGTLNYIDRGEFFIGENGSGYFYQYGGSVNVDKLIVGKQDYGAGYYELQNGTLVVDYDLWVGKGANSLGEFRQSGGSNTVYGSLFIDSIALSKGLYYLSGGNLEVYGNTVVGSFGSGSFYQSGGSYVTYGDLNIGEGYGSSGYYELTSGILSIGNAERIGVSGVGDFYQYDGIHTVQSGFVLANNPGSTGYFSLGGGSLSTGESFIGMNGYGYFSQTGGIHTTGYDLNIAQEKQSYGIYNLYDGLLSVGRHLHVGLAGEGYMEQYGGTLTVGSHLVLGNEKEGYGQFTMWDGTLTVAEDAFVGMAGTGTFSQWGGSVEIGGSGSNGVLILAAENDSYGSYTIVDGDLLANFIQVGASGFGEFFQNGGTLQVRSGGGINLGQVFGSEGRYRITKGELQAADLLIGASGRGVFEQEGGKVIIAQGVVLAGDVVGTALGTYDLKGGNLTSGNTQVGAWGVGIFTQTGGTHTTGFLGIGADVLGKGEYTLVSGDLIISGDTIVGWSGEGKFTQTGGKHYVAGELIVSWNAPQSKGLYEMSGGTLNASRITNRDTFVFDGGHIITNYLSNYGIFTGKGGTFEGDFSNFGTLSPGASPGVLTITGNYIQDPLGTLVIELAGYLQGTDYDFLSITGSATLDGTLKIVLLSGFSPVVGSDFYIIHADGGISGQFALLDLPNLGSGKGIKIIYLSNDVYAHVTPIPTSIILLGSGLLGIAGIMRKRL
ncbi:MAG: hypothetical protein QXI12_09295 [Candidatus Methanomethyliaceae archaeon]